MIHRPRNRALVLALSVALGGCSGAASDDESPAATGGASESGGSGGGGAGGSNVGGTPGAGRSGSPTGTGGMTSTGGSSLGGATGGSVTSGGTAGRAASGGNDAGGTTSGGVTAFAGRGGGASGGNAGTAGAKATAGAGGRSNDGGRGGANTAGTSGGAQTAGQGGGGSGGGANGTCPTKGSVTYTLARESSPTAAQTAAYDKITAAVEKALTYYNCYTNITKELRVSYVPSVATADGNVNGSIRFGSDASMNYITAMHEIGHTVGIGSNEWGRLLEGNLFTGPVATAKLREITGDPAAEVHGDAQHFWPYGLNYTSEVESEADLINHCYMVVAIREDIY